MAATFSHLNIFSRTKKHDVYLQYSDDGRAPSVFIAMNWNYLAFSWSGDIKRSCFCTSLATFNKTSGIQLRSKHQRLNFRYPFKSGSDIMHEEKKKDDISEATLIWRAVKLPMYSVALVPVTVGSAAAFLESGLFSAHRYFVLLVSFVLGLAWVNLRLNTHNDVYDFDTGADKNKKESVVNIVGSRTGPLTAAYISLFLGAAGIFWIILEAGSLSSMLLLACALTCGYIYQCPPFRLSYQGLGEPLVFAAFGPFCTTAFYLLQSGTSELPMTGTVLPSSFLVGFTSAIVLFCSHFHQIRDDAAVGKISPLVRLGTKMGSDVLKMAVIVLYLSSFVAGHLGSLPLASVILCALTIPIGGLLVKYVEGNHENDSKIFMSKYYCVGLHFAFGATLTAGLVATRMFAEVHTPTLLYP